MNTLDNLRQQLDTIDRKVAALLDERMNVIEQVADYKNAHGMPLTDSGRENEVIKNLKSAIHNNVLRETIEEMYQYVIDTAKIARILHTHHDLPYQTIGVIGLGLIGGSIVKTLKTKNQKTKILTLRRPSEDMKKAAEAGYLDTECEDWSSLVKQCDLIVIASPIDTVISSALEIQKATQEREKPLVVIDVASVKEKIANKFAELTTKNVEFVATHPMAGSEKIGFAHAKATLFIRCPWVITPHEKNNPGTLDAVQTFIRYLGSSPLVLESALHDRYAAIVSHLVFLISTYLMAYAKETQPEALEMAGNGFETTTRLASGSSAMHAQITMDNLANIQNELEHLLQFIQKNPITVDNALSFFTRYKKERDQWLENKT